MTVQLTSAVAAPVAVQRAPQVSLGRWVWSGGILTVLAFLVLYPLTTLLLGALTNANPVVEGIHARDLSLTNFIAVLVNPNVHAALINSLVVCGAGTVVAVVVGLTFSWVVVRTDTPGRRLALFRRSCLRLRSRSRTFSPVESLMVWGSARPARTATQREDVQDGPFVNSSARCPGGRPHRFHQLGLPGERGGPEPL